MTSNSVKCEDVVDCVLLLLLLLCFTLTVYCIASRLLSNIFFCYNVRNSVRGKRKENFRTRGSRKPMDASRTTLLHFLRRLSVAFWHNERPHSFYSPTRRRNSCHKATRYTEISIFWVCWRHAQCYADTRQNWALQERFHIARNAGRSLWGMERVILERGQRWITRLLAK